MDNFCITEKELLGYYSVVKLQNKLEGDIQLNGVGFHVEKDWKSPAV